MEEAKVWFTDPPLIGKAEIEGCDGEGWPRTWNHRLGQSGRFMLKPLGYVFF